MTDRDLGSTRTARWRTASGTPSTRVIIACHPTRSRFRWRQARRPVTVIQDMIARRNAGSVAATLAEARLRPLAEAVGLGARLSEAAQSLSRIAGRRGPPGQAAPLAGPGPGRRAA